MERLHVDTELLHALHRQRWANWPRLMAFVLIYIASGGGAYWLVSSHPRNWAVYLACLPLYLMAAASLHGISLFTHEAVHGTLCGNAKWNGALGAICAWPVLQNFSAYRVLHLKHHSHLGLPGDPDHYHNYTNWSWLLFAMNWGRLIVGYPAYIVAIPILALRQSRGRERIWILFESASVIALAAIVLMTPIPRGLLIHAWLIPMIFINTLVNVRGMSQHTFLENQSDTIRGTRSILTNPVTAFFMCNENYHLEHHLYPGVPWYNLPRLHRALNAELVERGAPYINSYFAFVREFIAGSVRRSPAGRHG
jgi:fatty acid desaturase